MKLNLPEVTLVCVDCEFVHRSVDVLDHCETMVDFAKTKLFTSLETSREHIEIRRIGHGDRVEGLIDYSRFMLNELVPHLDTSHFLVVQHDGWVLNPETWDPAWLQYDYIGPLFLQEDRVGSGGFSMRSKKLHEWLHVNARFDGQYFNGTDYVWEDGVIACGLRKKIEAAGFKFPPMEEAARFAYGGNKTHYCPEPFGFHGFYALDTLIGGGGEPIARNPQLATL